MGHISTQRRYQKDPESQEWGRVRHIRDVTMSDNGRSCFCCKLWNCHVMGEACMRVYGCVCECPVPEGWEDEACVTDVGIELGDVAFIETDPESLMLLEFLWMVRRTEDLGDADIPLNPELNKIELGYTSLLVGFRWGGEVVAASGGCEARGLSETMEVTVASKAKLGVSDAKGDTRVGLAGEEERAYGMRLGFPTTRRPISYKRLLVDATEAEMLEWKYNEMIGDTIDSEEKRTMVRRLLFTWRDLFVEDPEVMPVTDLVIHTIPTYDHIRPIWSKDRLYSQQEIQWQKDNIPRLVKAGVLSHCDSPWSARTKHPIKKDGTLRMVNIFCPINAATIKTNYPMKRIEPVVNLLSLEKYKCGPKFQADATNGYYAIPLWPGHAYKTAFSCSLGQYCYNVMGQGLSGAPHTYSRLKDIAMGPIPSPNEEPQLHGEITINEGSVAYEYFMDDDYGVATDFQSLFNFLHHHYFPRVCWARLTLKPKKTKFFCSSIDVLGHTLLESGLRPSMDKVAKIRDYPAPTNFQELERFLYMTTFLKRFIPGRAEHARKMKEAATFEGKRGNKVCVKWDWGQTQQESFDSVKQAIVENAMTGGDPSLQYHLCCDASKVGLGAVLCQLPKASPGTILGGIAEGAKEARVVMFISQQLSEAESRYLNTEREALAVLRALEEVRWLVVGSPFPVKVYTDHSALLSVLRGAGSHQGRITSWLMRLSEYNVEFHHVKGADNKVADGLSRLRSLMSLPRTECDDWENVAAIEVDTELWSKWLSDEWYGPIVHFLLTGSVRPEHNKRVVIQRATRYRIIEDGDQVVMYQESTGEWAKCVLRDGVERILERYHDSHGHFAGDMTLRLLRGKYYWPTRVKDTIAYTRSCDACQRFGPMKKTASDRELKPILNLQPMDMWGMDFVGPINPSSDGNRYILIVVDYFTRFLMAVPVERADGNTVRSVLNNIASVMGWPKAIYCDNASYFVKGVVPEELEKRKVLLFPAPITHPSSVGLAEKYVHLLMTGLRTASQGEHADLDRWSNFVSVVVFAVNNRIVRVHGFTPSQLLFGFSPRGQPEDYNIKDGLKIGLLQGWARNWGREPEEEWEGQEGARETMEVTKLGETNEEVGNYVWNHLSVLDEIRSRALSKYIHNQALLSARALQNQTSTMEVQKGDLVLLRRFAIDKDKGKKLETKWEGPYLVARVSYSKVSVILNDIITEKRKGRYSLDSIKFYMKREERVPATTCPINTLSVKWRKGERVDL